MKTEYQFPCEAMLPDLLSNLRVATVTASEVESTSTDGVVFIDDTTFDARPLLLASGGNWSDELLQSVDSVACHYTRKLFRIDRSLPKLARVVLPHHIRRRLDVTEHSWSFFGGQWVYTSYSCPFIPKMFAAVHTRIGGVEPSAAMTAPTGVTTAGTTAPRPDVRRDSSGSGGDDDDDDCDIIDEELEEEEVDEDTGEREDGTQGAGDRAGHRRTRSGNPAWAGEMDDSDLRIDLPAHHKLLRLPPDAPAPLKPGEKPPPPPILPAAPPKSLLMGLPGGGDASAAIPTPMHALSEADRAAAARLGTRDSESSSSHHGISLGRIGGQSDTAGSSDRPSVGWEDAYQIPIRVVETTGWRSSGAAEPSTLVCKLLDIRFPYAPFQTKVEKIIETHFKAAVKEVVEIASGAVLTKGTINPAMDSPGSAEYTGAGL